MFPDVAMGKQDPLFEVLDLQKKPPANKISPNISRDPTLGSPVRPNATKKPSNRLTFHGSRTLQT